MYRIVIALSLANLYLWPHYLYLSVGNKGVSPFTLSAILLLFTALTTAFFRPAASQRLMRSVRRSGSLVTMFTLYWCWQVLADGFGVTPSDSLYSTMINFTYYGFWFLSAAIIFTESSATSIWLIILAVTGVVASILGVLELTSGQSFFDMLHLSAIAKGTDDQLDEISKVLFRDGETRVRSLFRHPITYGLISGSILPVAFNLILGRNVQRISGCILAVSILVSLVIVNTRSSLFGAITGSAVYFAFMLFDPRSARSWVGSVLVICALVLVTPLVAADALQSIDGATSEQSRSSSYRSEQFSLAARRLNDSPLSGYGVGNAIEIAGIHDHGDSLTLDNYYITVAVDSGYVGLALFLAMCASFYITAYREKIANPDPRVKSQVSAAAGMVTTYLTGFSIHSLTDYLPFLYLTFGFVVALRGRDRIPDTREMIN